MPELRRALGGIVDDAPLLPARSTAVMNTSLPVASPSASPLLCAAPASPPPPAPLLDAVAAAIVDADDAPSAKAARPTRF
jgi:hypothetical protein